MDYYIKNIFLRNLMTNKSFAKKTNIQIIKTTQLY